MAALGMAGAAVPAAAQPAAASVAPKSMQAVAPALADYTDRVLFGDIWLRPDLSPRDRSIVTVAALIAMGRTPQLSGHIPRALDNGVTPAELAGVVTQLAFYTGWPNAVSAVEVLDRVFTERKVDMVRQRAATPSASGGRPPAPGADLAAIAPKFAELGSAVIEGDLWRRTDLSPRNRSLATVAALAAIGDQAQLAGQIRRARLNGLSRAEIVEAFTHLAFYAGVARAEAALRIAAAVFADQDEGKAASAPGERLRVVAAGAQPQAGAAANFTGEATVTARFDGATGGRPSGGTVSFRPGARTHWHTHAFGQLLIVTAGRGWVQAAGEPVRAIGPGDVVWTAPGVKHWHGATRDAAMTQVGVSEAGGAAAVTWLEPVSEAQYHGPR